MSPAGNLLLFLLFLLELRSSWGMIGQNTSKPITSICNLDEVKPGEGIGIYCTCRGDDDEIDCGCWNNPPEEYHNPLWLAMADFDNVAYMEFSSRPERSLKLLPPPYVFAKLKKLTSFITKTSEIRHIPPDAFGNSSSISILKMVDNLIHVLEPRSFSNLKNVSEIHLGQNEIKEVNRDVFTNLPNLHQLFLDRNKIEIVHDRAFKELGGNLKELDLKENNISILTQEMFDGLKKLSRLELQGNSIEFLGAYVFAAMPLLKELGLNTNKIRSISPMAFHHLHHLQRLDLKGNMIVELEAPLFSPMTKLYHLDLRNNELETFKEDAVEPIYANLKNVSMNFFIEGNRLVCDCQILWMHKLYRETGSIYVRENLEKIQCEVHKTDEEARRRIHRFTHPPNLTVESNAEDALDGMKNVIHLNPNEFNCPEDNHHHHHRQKDTWVIEKGEKLGGSESKKGLQQSHHQSHVAPYNDGASVFLSIEGFFITFMSVLISSLFV